MFDLLWYENTPSCTIDIVGFGTPVRRKLAAKELPGLETALILQEVPTKKNGRGKTCTPIGRTQMRSEQEAVPQPQMRSEQVAERSLRGVVNKWQCRNPRSACDFGQSHFRLVKGIQFADLRGVLQTTPNVLGTS